jgi:hypothetical protein
MTALRRIFDTKAAEMAYKSQDALKCNEKTGEVAHNIF